MLYYVNWGNFIAALPLRVMEAYNITNKKASAQLQKKCMHEGKHSERIAANNEMYAPGKPWKLCAGFSYIGPKVLNLIPKEITKRREDIRWLQNPAKGMDMEENALLNHWTS